MTKFLLFFFSDFVCIFLNLRAHNSFLRTTSPADFGLDLDLRCIENVVTDYDSQHLQTSEYG